MDPEGHASAPSTGPASRSVASNTFFLAIADAAGRVMSLVFYTTAARHLGVAGFGVLSFSLAFISLFSVLADLGIGMLATREIARDRGVAYGFVSRGVSIRLASSLLVAATAVGAALLLGYPGATVQVVAVCSAMMVSNMLVLFYANVVQAFESNAYTALARIAQTVVMIAGAIAVSRLAPSVVSYAVVATAASVLAAVVLFATVSMRFVRPALDFRLRRWVPLLRSSTPFWITTILVAFYYWSGSTILSKITGEVAVGEFGAAFRLVAGVGFLGVSFSGAVYPVISRLFAADPQRWPEPAERSLRFAINLAVAQGVLGLALAKPVVAVLYGGGYAGAVRVLVVLVWWGAFATLNVMLSNLLFSANRQRLVTCQAGVSAAVNAALNFLLIPSLGATGAAIALASAEAAGVAVLLAGCLRAPHRLRPGVLAATTARAVAAAVPAAVLAVLVSAWRAWPGLVVAPAVYVALLFLTGALGAADLDAVRGFVRARNA